SKPSPNTRPSATGNPATTARYSVGENAPAIPSTMRATSRRSPPTRCTTAAAIASASVTAIRRTPHDLAHAAREDQVGHADADLEVERQTAETQYEHHRLVGRQQRAEERDRHRLGEAGAARCRREIREHQIRDHGGERAHADVAPERVEKYDAERS